MTEFKNVVLTTDLSANADAAIPLAAALAKRNNGTIHLFHAFEETSTDALLEGVVIGSIAWLNAIHRQREKDVKELSSAIALKYGVNTDYAIGRGNPAVEVTKFAERCKADLIVTSTHGWTGLTHLVLGSVAERVLRLSRVPVLTIKPGGISFDSKSKLKTVLMPTDFSENANAAKPYAVALAQKDGAKLTLVHVIDDSVYYTTLEPGLYLADSKQWIEALRADAEKKLSDTAGSITANSGVKCEIIQASGLAADRICQIAKDRKADLIVISTHGYTGLSHLVFGSVAEKVVRMSPIPVLSVKPQNIAERK